MIDWFQRLTYEAPATVMLGPIASALFAGFAVFVGDRLCLTEAGERYLADIEQREAVRYG